MKKLLLIFLTIPLLFVSCISEIGPPGQDGLDGLNIAGKIFEANVDFNTANNFEFVVGIPSQIEVLPSDIAIGYILSGVNNGADVWEPLPQTLFFDDGTLLYGFNHTTIDVKFFMDGTVNLENLLAELTQDIVFRIAIIPADAAKKVNSKTLSMKDLLGSIKEESIIKLK
ncbi:MAG: hypothetical protein L3J08_08295 [Flavobacteriaceae bacterium]|nr:hypothetical protein [Flavobacteriaceae bacterium]